MSQKKGENYTKARLTKRDRSSCSSNPPARLSDPKPDSNATRLFSIAGVGASAGGLKAIEEFFTNVPANCGVAFVLVAHYPPNAPSMLPTLLDQCTVLKINLASDGTKVEPNQIYVVPAGRYPALLNGVIHFMGETGPGAVHLPIDFFFRSLAQDQKHRAVAVILSGTGSDGTLGLQAIKNEGGMVMAQDARSAEYLAEHSGMPRSAIATHMVDFVMPAAEMPGQLMAYTRGRYVQDSPFGIDPGALLDASAVEKIFVLLRSRTGHDFSSYKISTLRRRIARRMNLHLIDDLKNYIRFLQENPHEIDLLFKEMLIGVTSFFRDPAGFESLVKEVLPRLLDPKPANSLVRIWVPGCSTGEEAYSIAMLVQEYAERTKKHLSVQIFATDLDSEAIDFARACHYPEGIRADVSPERLERFFVKEGSGYRIRKEIREMVIFAVHNLVMDPPFTRLDLISCRNLLIYLDTPIQRKLIPLFHYALRPRGMLFLGSSESIGGFADLFVTVDKHHKIFERKDGSAVSHPLIQLPSSAIESSIPRVQSMEKPGKEKSISELIERLLLKECVPACAIVSERGDIVYIHGRTGLFLEPSMGRPSHNIFDMAHEGLQHEISSGIRRAASTEIPISRRGISVKSNSDSIIVNLVVRKILQPEPIRGLFMVLFEKAEPITAEGEASNQAADKTEGGNSELERELQYTKEHLQSTIEELEVANEELKSTNEELQSTNEELQSTNEELETTKEETQSLNEELQTVNIELQRKLEDLSQASDDMTTLLNSTDIATIFLDNFLNLKRFTVQAKKVINLIASDIGRPISDIVSKIDCDSILQDAQEVLQTLGSKEKEVRTKDGCWYLMSMRPYRTSSNMIGGVVMTFVDISKLKEAEEAAYRGHLTQDLAELVSEPLVILDRQLNVLSANQAFLKSFKLTNPELHGASIYNLSNGEWNFPKLHEFFEQALTKKGPVKDREIEHMFPSIGRKRLRLNIRISKGSKPEQEAILLTIKDVTRLDMELSKNEVM